MKVITIGRSPDNDVCINDPHVGRHHCQIEQYDKGTYAIVDMNSLNGTYINGVRIFGKARLQPYDTVTIGQNKLPWMSYFTSVVQFKCPDCGRVFQGDACPNCGCPAKECSTVEQFIHCPQCGNQVSNKTVRCPYCGLHIAKLPIQFEEKQSPFRPSLSNPDIVAKRKSKTGLWIGLGVSGAVLLLLLLLLTPLLSSVHRTNKMIAQCEQSLKQGDISQSVSDLLEIKVMRQLTPRQSDKVDQLEKQINDRKKQIEQEQIATRKGKEDLGRLRRQKEQEERHKEQEETRRRNEVKAWLYGNWEYSGFDEYVGRFTMYVNITENNLRWGYNSSESYNGPYEIDMEAHQIIYDRHNGHYTHIDFDPQTKRLLYENGAVFHKSECNTNTQQNSRSNSYYSGSNNSSSYGSRNWNNVAEQLEKLDDEEASIISKVDPIMRSGQFYPDILIKVMRMKQINDERIRLASQHGDSDLVRYYELQKIRSEAIINQWGF